MTLVQPPVRGPGALPDGLDQLGVTRSLNVGWNGGHSSPSHSRVGPWDLGICCLDPFRRTPGPSVTDGLRTGTTRSPEWPHTAPLRQEIRSNGVTVTSGPRFSSEREWREGQTTVTVREADP